MREKWRQFGLSERACTIASLVAVLAVFVMAVSAMSSQASYVDQYSANDAQIQSVKADIALFEDEPLNEETVRQTLHSAAAVGNEVADLQNKIGYADEETGPPMINRLLDLFGDQQISDVWAPVDTRKVKPNWQFATTFGFTADTVDVVWLCYAGDTDVLLAYTTAVYSVETGMFSEVDKHFTSEIAQYYPDGN